MKRFLFFFLTFTSYLHTMQSPKFPNLSQHVTQLTLLFRKKTPLSSPELQKASELIKEMRAQSPTSAFAYKERLCTTIIRTDSPVQPTHINREGIARGPSPLIASQVLTED